MNVVLHQTYRYKAVELNLVLLFDMRKQGLDSPSKLNVDLPIAVLGPFKLTLSQ